MGERIRRNQTLAKHVIEEAGRCELCGSKRNLEAHHIVPIVCGGPDEYDNLLCVCGRCHSLLTPKKTLTKIGLRLANTWHFSTHPYRKLQEDIYKNCDRRLKEYGIGFTKRDIFDAIDEEFEKKINEIEEKLRIIKEEEKEGE